MSSPGRIRTARRRRIPGGATTSASGNSDDGVTIADSAGKMGALGIFGVELVGDDDLDTTQLLHLVLQIREVVNSPMDQPLTLNAYQAQAPRVSVIALRFLINPSADCALIMAAMVISISSDVSFESVGSSFLRVILIGSISIKVPVAPEVGAAVVASPAKIPTAPILPAPSSIVASSSGFPLAHAVAPPGIRQRRAILIRPGEDIPIGQLYRTHPSGPCRALTVRKSVRPLPSHRLALMYTSHHLDHFTFRSSSGHSSLDHSSSEHSILGHSLSAHASPDTTVADSSTPPRFVHPPRVRTPRFLSCVDLLPPRKRFRDSISPEYSVEDIDMDVLEDIKTDVMAVEVAVDRDVVTRVDADIDLEVDVGVDVEDEVEDEVESSDRGTMEVGVDVAAGIDIPDGMLMPDAVEHLEQVEEGLQDIYEHVVEIPLQRIEDIETGQRGLEAKSLITGREIASLLDQAIEELVNQRVEEALAAYEATHAANDLEAKNQSQNGSNSDNENSRNGNGGDGNGENGNGENGNGGNGNPNKDNRGARPVTQECTYQDFMECQPLNFKGTEKVVRLIRWFEKIETVFHILNCPEEYQVKYATYTLLNSALTWWNSHRRTIRADAAFAMS
nr:reverse transcriptase domain-containing protein [Tanacetum cinerariifolium]